VVQNEFQYLEPLRRGVYKCCMPIYFSALFRSLICKTASKIECLVFAKVFSFRGGWGGLL